MAFSNLVKIQIPAKVHVLSITEKRNLAKNLSFLEILISLSLFWKYENITVLAHCLQYNLLYCRKNGRFPKRKTETEQKKSHM